ncbi:hypothetical protein GXW71_06485 [Roseomonas hellenica]|uniref:N-acetyltransferase domain-containing protein n=1 Tax=Plastoroseomonas hellenica TaxID=2687306 RepID=A0ABS5EUP6_9PROT|nr:hypothetical protein [Plastoroseomonas hellenica]MBR0664000.1 hypothetical protein [Plastoroseomonas hellenica]
MYASDHNACIEDNELSIRELDIHDLDSLINVHQKIVEALPSPSLFRARGVESIRSLIGDDSSCFGIFDGKALVAYSAVRFPESGTENLGIILGFDQYEAQLVAEFEGVAVLPKYRGNGLQDVLTKARAAKAILRGRLITAARVSPENFHSLRNFLAYGMTGRKFVRLSGGYERLIVVRNHVDGENPSWMDETEVIATDFAGLNRAFDTGLELRAFDNARAKPVFVLAKRRRSTESRRRKVVRASGAMGVALGPDVIKMPA